MGEKGIEGKEERGCERVERGREREMELEGERGKMISCTRCIDFSVDGDF